MNNNPNALPSYNIADVDTEIGFYKTLFHLHDKGMMSCLPAIVEKYDRATHIAEVKPLVKSTMRLEDEEVPFDRPTYRVPVQQMCHGGFNIDAPLFVGDTGLLFAIDREWITARKQNSAALIEPQDPEKGEENPNKGAVVPDSYGLASFEYGFFLPCSWAKTDLKDEDGFVVRLPIKDGEVVIRIDKDGTTTFSEDVVFNNPVTFKDKITGTEGEFSGLIKANDFKTDDCEILELDVVIDAVTENETTTLKIGKFKFLRSQIIGDVREVQVINGGGEIIEVGVGNVNIDSPDGSISVVKKTVGNVITFELTTEHIELFAGKGIGIDARNTISNTGVTSIIAGTGPTSLNGDISIEANADSGISVTVDRVGEITGGNKYTNGVITVDLKDREDGDSFGIKTLTVSGDTDSESEEPKVVKFFATEDLSISLNRGVVIDEAHSITMIDPTEPPSVSVVGDGTKNNPITFSFEIPEGDSIVGASTGTPSEADGYTSTPITFSLKSGGIIGPCNVMAKNGVGIRSITSDATESEETTSTNVTVSTTDGGSKEFVVVAKNGEDGVGIQNITYTTGDSGITVTITLTNNTTSSFIIPTAPTTSKEIDVITDIDLSYDSESGTLTLSRTKKKATVIAVEEDAESSTPESTSVTLFNLENLTTVVSDVTYSTSNLALTKKTIQIPSLIATQENSANVFTAAKHETDI